MHKWLTSCLLALLLVPCALPQATSGRVSGTVRDQSGAVVPDAEVVLLNTATSIRSSTRTNDGGFYLFPGIQPGSYQVSVTSKGMDKFEAAFEVQVSQSVVIDSTLKTGQLATSVVVTAATPMVTVDNYGLQQGLERQRIQDLPVNGRSFNALMTMMPGMEGNSSFGAAAGSRDYLVDGMSQVDRQWDDAPMAGANLDSIQEFTVQSYAVSAKLSRPTSIIASTKSGSNSLHGTAFETNRNSAIGVARNRTDTFAKAPPLNRNEFGFSGGAPVIIPKIYNGKDRTFWFFSYEGMRLVQSKTAGYRVPTMAMRAGDFSELKDSLGRLQVLYDPWSTGADGTRQPFAYGGKLNAIDPSRISPVAKDLYALTPAPTTAENPLLAQNWWGPQSGPDRRFQIAARFDHRISDRDSVYSVINAGKDTRVYDVAGVFGGGAQGMQYSNQIAGWQYYATPQESISVTWTHTFSPTLFNEAMVSLRHQSQIGGEGDGTGTNSNVNWADKWNLPNPFNSTKWPFFQETGLDGYAYTTNDTKSNWMTYAIFEDNATKVIGAHELQFGVHMRNNILNSLAKQRYAQPWVTWNTGATSQWDKASSISNPQSVQQTGSNLANMFLGVSWYQNTLCKGMYYLRDKDYAGYLQDNWKATPQLTLNFGLRYEYWPGFREKNNIMTGFDLNNHAIVLGRDLNTLYGQGSTTPELIAMYQNYGVKFETWDQAGMPQSLVNSNKANLGPRIGFAYKMFGASNNPLVLRGGYSVSYFQEPLSGWNDADQNNTPLSANFNYNPNDATQSPDTYPSWLMRNVPVYKDGVNSRDAVNMRQPRGIARGSSGSYFRDPDAGTPTLQGWNFTLEREVMNNTVARARYIGSHQSNLLQTWDMNPNTPDYIWFTTQGTLKPTGAYANVAARYYDQNAYGTIQMFRHTGYSNYNAVDLEIERRFVKGFAYQVSYVIANQIGATGGMSQPNQFLPNLVSSDYDQRNEYLNYARSSGVPHHRIKGNWLLDLPFGAGKMIGGNSTGLLQKVIGGWQLAGLGNLRTTYFTLPTNNWNFTGEPLHEYGYQYPIQDCTSGTCYPGYLWYNGYIPSNRINSYDANGKPNGIMGVPADYKPVQTPLIPYGSTTLPANAPANTNLSSNYDTNNVWVVLKDGSAVRTGYNTGLHPWRNQYRPSVRQWGLDASLFKVVDISERFKVRINADFFNVLNAPGNPNSVGTNGVLSTRTSGNTPRLLQLTLRLSW